MKLTSATLDEPILVTEPGVYYGNGHGTVLVMLDPSKPLIDIQCGGVTIRDCILAGDGQPRTAPLVNTLCNGTKLEGLRFRDFWIAVNVGDPSHQAFVPRILSCDFQSPIPQVGGGCILMQNFGGALISGCTLSGPSSVPQCDWGIRVRQGDTLLISDTNVTLCGYGLYVDTPAGQFLGSLKTSNCLFDSGWINASGQYCSAALLAPYGSVWFTRFENTWFGLSNRYGLELIPQGNGSIHYKHDNCDFVGNVLGSAYAAGNVIWE